MKPRELNEFVKFQHQELAKLKAELTGLESAYFHLVESKARKHRKDDKIDFTSPNLRRITNLLQEISYESFITMRDVYIRYSTILDIDFNGFMDLYQLRLLLSEVNLLSNRLTMPKVDLIYASVRKNTKVDFWKFIKIMKTIGKIRYPYLSSQDVLQHIALDLHLPTSRLDSIDSNLHSWKTYYKNPEIATMMVNNKKLLSQLFVVYAKKRGTQIEIMEFLQLCSDAKIIPKFVSMWETGRIFRGVQPYECFTDSLGYSEFEECCLCLAIYMMEKEILSDAVQAFHFFCRMMKENFKTFMHKKYDMTVQNVPKTRPVK